MSASSTAESPQSDIEGSKFTRGEKCLFIHLVVTFSVILFLIFIYFIHLCVVPHSLRDVWKITRRAHARTQDFPEIESYPVGHVYLKDRPVRLLCNTVLLRARWSVGPAHCVAMRTDPDMASFLHTWRIRYAKQGKGYEESNIKRTIPHPHFDRDDFRNGIGLFEHETDINIPYFNFNKILGINDNTLMTYANRLSLFGWRISSTAHGDEQVELVRDEVQPISTPKCARFMTPILDLRTYEYCVVLRRPGGDINPGHGSVLVIGSQIMGLFGWGEKTGRGVPFIILDLLHFKDWLENIIAW